MLSGGSGIDQVIGDGGDDILRGDAGDGSSQAGQRLFGGLGRDTLFAFSDTTNVSNAAGDQLFGDAGGDFLHGNVRVELFVGGSGNDFITGDEFAGPNYEERTDADVTGANDVLLGGSGEDQLFGGGGDDEIWGGSGTDYIVGQQGSDLQYGGSGIDLFVLPTSLGSDNHIDPGTDTIDGHFGNSVAGDVPDDNATDILAIDGTTADDQILIGAQAGGQAAVSYNGNIVPVNLLVDGNIVVEQFRVAGLTGDDTIGFYTDDVVASGALAESLTAAEISDLEDDLVPLDLSVLSGRSRDWVGVFDGNSGDDTLVGSDGRDRLDGGVGSDILYGFTGDDRLWGDAGGGTASDNDTHCTLARGTTI